MDLISYNKTFESPFSPSGYLPLLWRLDCHLSSEEQGREMYRSLYYLPLLGMRSTRMKMHMVDYCQIL